MAAKEAGAGGHWEWRSFRHGFADAAARGLISEIIQGHDRRSRQRAAFEQPLHAATSSNLLHAGCGQRLRYDKYRPRHGKLDPAAILKGYEYAPGQFLVLDEAELEYLRPARDRAQTLDNFIDIEQIDPLLYAGRSLYLAPPASPRVAAALGRSAGRS